MGATKEMTLQIRIQAAGAQARAMLRSVEGQLNSLSTTMGRFGHVAAQPFKWAGSAMGMLFKPLAIGGKILGAATAGITALGGAALYAAAGDEELGKQMEDVYGSTKRGSKVYAELESMSRRSEFSTESLAGALVGLKNYGLASSRNLRVLAASARSSGEDVGELAMSVMALQARSLKKFGIEIDQQAGERAVVSWRDAMGRVIKVTATSAEEARKTLLNVLEMRFGSNINPRTFKGFIAMLKNNIGDALGDLGQAALPFATDLVKRMSEKLTAMIESGKFAEWGEKAAKWLKDAFVYGQTVFEHASALLKAAMEKGSGAITETLKIVFVTGAMILGTAFVNYLAATGVVWMGIGKIVAGAFMDDILKLPGFANERIRQSRDTIEEISRGDNRDLKAKMWAILDKYPDASKTGKLPMQAELDIISLGRNRWLEAGIKDLGQRLPALGAETAAYAKEKITQATEKIEKVTDYPGPNFQTRLAANRAATEERLNPEPQMVEYKAARWNRERGAFDYSTIQSKEGTYRPGQITASGFGVYVAGDIKLSADSIRAMSEQLKHIASKAPRNAAATR
jgi:hypothetical protein